MAASMLACKKSLSCFPFCSCVHLQAIRYSPAQTSHFLFSLFYGWYGLVVFRICLPLQSFFQYSSFLNWSSLKLKHTHTHTYIHRRIWAAVDKVASDMLAIVFACTNVRFPTLGKCPLNTKIRITAADERTMEKCWNQQTSVHRDGTV